MAGIYSKLTEKIGRLTDHSKDLDIFWDGDANTAFMAALGSDIANALVILVKLRMTLKLVADALEIYSSNEREVQRIIGTTVLHK